MTRRPLLVLLSCLLVAACGDDSSNPGGGKPGSPVTIRGGERIEWDQPVESPEAALVYSYTLYVDGAQVPLTEVRCADRRSAAGVTCSGRLPSMPRGGHSIEITASINGIESGRSQPLAVSVSSVALLGVGNPYGMAAARDGFAGGAICLDAASQECYLGRAIAVGLGEVTTLVPTETGALLVEGGNRVRVVIGDTLEEEPALTMAAGERITALAVPPDFASSRLLFLAWSEPAPDGGEALNVTRYRELAGRLGEGATIVTGLPLPAGGAAPMAIDDRGSIYVALPAASPGDPAPAAAALSNFVLRFDSEGATTANPYPSPVFAHGYARPSSLVWDGLARQLWLSGADSRWSSTVSTLSVERDDSAEWPRRPSPALVPETTPTLEAPVIALTTDSSSLERQLWLVPVTGAPRRTVLRAGRPSLQRDPIGFQQMGRLLSIAEAPDGSLIVATRSGQASFASEIWRLTSNKVLDPGR